MPLGAPWGSEGHAWEVLHHLGDGLDVTLKSVDIAFYDLLRNVWFCDFDVIVQRRLYLRKSGRPSWSYLGSKDARAAQSGFEGASQTARTVKFGRSVQSCCRSYGN